MMKRPTPLAVRISQADKNALTEIAVQLKTSRNHLVCCACASYVRDLKAEKLVGMK